MSMITEQVERIRRLADEMEKSTFVHEATYFIAIKALREAADTIERLAAKVRAANMERSTAYYNGGWIPVSERLPKKGKQVLCCNKSGSVFTSAITYINSNGMVAFGQHYEVIAWMPLPEPYREEGDKE